MSSCQCVICSLETKPFGAWNYTNFVLLMLVINSFSASAHYYNQGTRSYFVFLAKGAPGQIDEDPNWLERWLKIGLTPTVDVQHCGGSLLTPSVVQTACHCLAKYTKQEGHFSYATPLVVWEDRIYSYVGSNLIDGLRYMLIPKHYIIHEACRSVTAIYTKLIFDFAVIVNKDSIYEKAKGAKISYAPIYRGVDIRNFYYTALEKEYTCLVIGFGKWAVHPPGGRADIDASASKVLRWGWRSLRSYKDCMALTYPRAAQKMGIYSYRKHSTWACFSSTTKVGFHHSGFHGDSGGPVSCNNVYFAIQSFIVFLDDSRLLELMASPTAHTSFENAAESRDDFIKFCNEFGVDDKPYLPKTPPPNPYKPTPPPRRSQCPVKIVLHRFMILSSTLCTWLSYHYSFPLY